jgi:hypothetical protein
MKPMKTNLDDRLMQWASFKAPSRKHVAELTRRITREARYARHEVQAVVEKPGSVPGWSKLAYAGLGAGVTCLVLVLAGLVFLPRRNPEENGFTALVGISAEQRASQGRLFSEMNRMFTEGLRWVVQSGGEVGIGLDTVPVARERDTPPLLVRVTVLARSEGETTWRQAWSADMMVHDQDIVEVAPDPRSNNTLAVWVYALEDGKLAVDTQVALTLPVALTSRLNTVVTRGLPTEIAATRTRGVEYRIFQTVDTVNASRS